MKQLRKQIGQSWKLLANWIDSRKLSERAMLFAAMVAVLVLLLNQIFLHAASVRIASQTKQMIADRAATRKLQGEIQKLAREVVVDPDADNRGRLQKLVAEETETQAAISRLSKDLVSPDQMVAMLGDIMARQGNLELVSLTKLPILSVSTGAANAAPATTPTGTPVLAGTGRAEPVRSPSSDTDIVYKHGVEIVVQGSYPELMAYLAQLENLPHRVVWGNLRLRVEAYPKTTMTLTMYTLSLEKKWLNI